jgi:hypothetical protein
MRFSGGLSDTSSAPIQFSWVKLQSHIFVALAGRLEKISHASGWSDNHGSRVSSLLESGHLLRPKMNISGKAPV